MFCCRTTQPAPHLDGVHVVFGEVVSGQNVVLHVEQLPVDRMNRPLQDAKVVNCGELVLKPKSKPKKVEPSSDEAESSADSDGSSQRGESDEGKSKKKKKKKDKKSETTEDITRRLLEEALKDLKTEK
uniref:PPIase cyclophilin-type domain-containing protein n=1 Tax=Lygus hesperus TaxID=30085 RepID=A0A0K8T3D3_LYGHE